MRPLYRLFFFFSALFTCLASSQTLLVSTPLELKRGNEFHQAMNAVDEETNEVYAFVVDKQQIHLLHYNRAFFLRDTMSVPFTDKQYPSLFGYGFENAQPVLFLTGDDLRKITQVRFDVKNKTASTQITDFLADDENFVCSFTQGNTFYTITTTDKSQNLTLHIFKDGIFKKQPIDFSGYEFSDAQEKPIAFSEVLRQFPIRKMESQAVNMLMSGISKCKLFVENGKLILTIDSNPKLTSVFQISLNDFSIVRTDIAQVIISPENPQSSQYSNSYYGDERLYQLHFNEEKLLLSSQSVKTPGSPITYSLSTNDTQAFANSRFLSQTGYQQPTEINLKRFFRKLVTAEAGLTVYTTADKDILITVGGLRSTITTGNAILGVALGAGSIAVGGSGDVVELFDNDTAQTIYFESFFDQGFKHLDAEPETLADDYISQFLDENDHATIPNVFRVTDFYVLAYYDKKAKQYLLRKFRDGGVD